MPGKECENTSSPSRGGRPKGSPNRRSLAAAERLAALGCDPLEGMARIAMDKSNSVELRAKMFAELAPYVEARRKPVDAEGSSDDRLIVEIVRFSAASKAAV